jgi:hypothetical protein
MDVLNMRAVRLRRNAKRTQFASQGGSILSGTFEATV